MAKADRPYWVHSQPEADESQHPCARAEWCYSRRILWDGEKKTILGGLTYRVLCEPCTGHLAECVRGLPASYDRMQAEIGERPRKGQAARVPFGPRLPLREDVDALMRLTAVTLAGWEARVRAVARLTPRDLSVPPLSGKGVVNAARILEDHIGVMLALQPAWMTRVVVLQPARRQELPPIGDELLAVIGEEDLVRAGVDFLTTGRMVGGEDAAREILRLHYRALSLLGEAGYHAETLDGVPCRSCEDMALERAEPPSDPALPAMWSVCASCRATMSREDFIAWAAMYAKWADSARRACRRCELGLHGDCVYQRCACDSPDHRRAAA